MSITGRFDSKLGDFHLDVAFSIPDRGVTGIFGPSGCGKTSLLRAIAGLDWHANGQLKVAATIWQDERVFLAPHRRPVAFVFQQANLFEHLSVQANLEYGWKRIAPGQRRIALPRIIELLDLGSLANRRPARLSGGEQQRVAIGRALAASPELLLMDEPLASLDLARRNEILPYLESLHAEFDLPVIYVTHDRQELGRLADHLLLMHKGSIRASGLCQDLFTELEQPLAREDDSASILQAKVISTDSEYHLSCVRCGDIDLIVTGDALPVGHEARLSIAARDVSITLSKPIDSSILNIMPATIESITEPLQGRVTLRLRCGEIVLLSHVTHRSAAQLNLQEGQLVFAQVKSIALSKTGSIA